MTSGGTIVFVCIKYGNELISIKFNDIIVDSFSIDLDYFRLLL